MPPVMPIASCNRFLVVAIATERQPCFIKQYYTSDDVDRDYDAMAPEDRLLDNFAEAI